MYDLLRVGRQVWSSAIDVNRIAHLAWYDIQVVCWKGNGKKSYDGRSRGKRTW